MESIKYTVKLDLTDNGTINTGWRIKQGDFRNIILIVKVVNNNEVYFSAENIPSILFHRPDGKTVIGKMDAYANDCYAYSIIGNELAVAGPVVMDVKFNDNGRTSTASCVFECVVDTIDGTATPADIYPGITLEEVQEKATVVATDVATEVATIVAEEIAKEYASSGITLTSASPLLSSAAAGIVGLQAKGKSEQNLQTYDGSYTLGKTSSGGSAPTRSISNLIPISAGAHKVKAINLPSNIWYSFLEYPSNSYANGKELLAGKMDTNEYTVTVDSGYSYFAIYFGSRDNTTMTSAMFAGLDLHVEGTPTPTNPIPIVDASGVVEAHTKNLFKKEIGGFDGNGAKAVNINNIRNVDFIKLYSNNYYVLSYIINGSHTFDNNVRIYTYDLNKKFVESHLEQFGVAFKPTSDCYINITKGCGSADNALNTEIQLEQGTTASEYVPYTSNEINLSSIGIDLRSVGNVKDEVIVKPDGTAEWVQNAKKSVVDGSFDIYVSSWANQTNTVCVYWTNDGLNPDYQGVYAMADKLPAVSRNYGANNDAEMVCMSGGSAPYSTAIRILKSRIEGWSDGDTQAVKASKVKAWLVNNPITVYYPLATSIVHTLTSEQVAAILALQTYAGTTIVESELDEVVVDYVGDTKAYIDSKFEYLYELIRSYHPEAQMMSLNDEPTAEEEEGENV